MSGSDNNEPADGTDYFDDMQHLTNRDEHGVTFIMVDGDRVYTRDQLDASLSRREQQRMAQLEQECDCLPLLEDTSPPFDMELPETGCTNETAYDAMTSLRAIEDELKFQADLKQLNIPDPNVATPIAHASSNDELHEDAEQLETSQSDPVLQAKCTLYQIRQKLQQLRREQQQQETAAANKQQLLHRPSAIKRQATYDIMREPTSDATNLQLPTLLPPGCLCVQPSMINPGRMLMQSQHNTLQQSPKRASTSHSTMRFSNSKMAQQNLSNARQSIDQQPRGATSAQLKNIGSNINTADQEIPSSCRMPSTTSLQPNDSKMAPQNLTSAKQSFDQQPRGATRVQMRNNVSNINTAKQSRSKMSSTTSLHANNSKMAQQNLRSARQSTDQQLRGATSIQMKSKPSTNNTAEQARPNNSPMHSSTSIKHYSSQIARQNLTSGRQSINQQPRSATSAQMRNNVGNINTSDQKITCSCRMPSTTSLQPNDSKMAPQNLTSARQSIDQQPRSATSTQMRNNVSKINTAEQSRSKMPTTTSLHANNSKMAQQNLSNARESIEQQPAMPQLINQIGELFMQLQKTELPKQQQQPQVEQQQSNLHNDASYSYLVTISPKAGNTNCAVRAISSPKLTGQVVLPIATAGPATTMSNTRSNGHLVPPARHPAITIFSPDDSVGSSPFSVDSSGTNLYDAVSQDPQPEPTLMERATTTTAMLGTTAADRLQKLGPQVKSNLRKIFKPSDCSNQGCQ